MKSQDTIQHRWFGQVWNEGRADMIDELTCHDVIGHGIVDHEGNEIRGVDAFRRFYKSFRGAFPDIHIAIEDTVSEGDRIVSLCRVTATHLGDGLGVAPTNKKVEFTGMCMMRIKDGMIAESWNSFDFLTLFQQIGLVQMPPPKGG